MVTVLIGSCNLQKELDPESETDKTIRVFTEGGQWKLDTLILKTDVLSGSVRTITSDSTFINFGTIEFQQPNQTKPAYGAGYMIHRYTKNGVSKIDTAAWVPYNFNSGSNGTVTLFFSKPGRVFVVNYYGMYLDINAQEKIKFASPVGGGKQYTEVQVVVSELIVGTILPGKLNLHFEIGWFIKQNSTFQRKSGVLFNKVLCD